MIKGLLTAGVALSVAMLAVNIWFTMLLIGVMHSFYPAVPALGFLATATAVVIVRSTLGTLK